MLLMLALTLLICAVGISLVTVLLNLPCVVAVIGRHVITHEADAIKIGKRIIFKKESVDWLLDVATIRLMVLFSFFLDLILVLLYFYIQGTIPASLVGTFEAIPNAEGVLVGNITIRQQFFEVAVYFGFMFALMVGFAIVFFERMLAMKGYAYRHTYEKLLPQITDLLCGGNATIEQAIKDRKEQIVTEKDKQAIRDILVIMKKLLYP